MINIRKNTLARRTMLASLGTALIGGNTLVRAGNLRARGGDTEGKFSPDGNVLPWAGDTIISPLPVNSPAFAEMLRINVEVTRHFRNYIAATPPASYHMTIYGGADPQRREARWWPKDVPLDTPIQRVNQLLLERLKKNRFEYSPPFRMKVDPGESFPALTVLPLLPADTAQHDELYKLRASIARQIGLMTPNIETFRFHMTFGYQFREMPQAVAQDFRRLSLEWRKQVAERVSIIELPSPVYCRFIDMFVFEPLLTLPQRM